MINQNPKYKIALVGDSLAGGGAEKVHAQLSVFFTGNGMEVSNCIFMDQIGYEHSGSLLNLGKIRPGSPSAVRKTARFFAFQRFIAKNNFDCVIDFRMRPGFFREFLISRFVYDSRCAYSVRSGILEYYFPKATWLSRLVYSDKKIHTVSQAVSRKILEKGLADTVFCIPNPIDFESIASKKEAFGVSESNYIIAVGRMNDQIKQFDKLLAAYAQSTLPGQDIRLLILGEGHYRNSYEKMAAGMGLSDKIIFKGRVENPFPYYKNALFLVLSSKNEGFPNVIAESLATGTPAVAFDCFSGPNEIISHQQNGLLVEDQHFGKLTEAMNLMVANKELYHFCKNNARQSVARFSLENIGKQWLDYLKIA